MNAPATLSADIGYMGGGEPDIKPALSSLTGLRPGDSRVSRAIVEARILDTPQAKRSAACYTGLDNKS